ncbi:uncharacterized protein LOC126842241 [Adelges cooleyi]|uniref:uncharacterized protein LOC126842241 n=1 Tax=Adelges cooleyi TaxID=133065 RepID=UPI00217F5940|nr:uncharacterized protein LOC126842241 [Adelges cooleyi]
METFESETGRRELENVEENIEQGQVNQGGPVVFKACKLIINDEEQPKGILGNQDINIRWNGKDRLVINNKSVTPDNGYENIKIKYDSMGGITVNKQYIKGFEGLKATGQTILRLPNIKTDARDDEGCKACDQCLADDLNIVGDDGESVAQSTVALINEAKTIGLNVNDNKTKVMELLPENNQVGNVVIQGRTFEKVH